MKKELDDQLCAKYPKIFANRNKPMQETAMCFGFCCGDGWYDIIDQLCSDIQTYIDQQTNVPQVVAFQVKEKFGQLRFYIDGGDKKVLDMIDSAETTSGQTCDQCGNAGKPSTSSRGWRRTRCEEHNKDKEIE